MKKKIGGREMKKEFKKKKDSFRKKKQKKDSAVTLTETEKGGSSMPAAADTETENGKMLSLIRSAAENGLDGLETGTELKEAGIDSVTFIRIIIALEEEYRFEFEDEKLMIEAFPTVRDLMK